MLCMYDKYFSGAKVDDKINIFATYFDEYLQQGEPQWCECAEAWSVDDSLTTLTSRMARFLTRR